LSKSGTTFGTFTAAGIVKRGLAAVGFTIQKRNGFGRKRDMLTGVFDDANEHVPTKLRVPQGPYYRYPNKVNVSTDTVVVVGSGLGAASTCLSLVKRGIKTTLCFDGHTPATGASGNPQGGFYPQLHSEASIASRLQAHSFLYARQCYDDVLRYQPDVPHAFCGVIQLSFNDKVAARQTKLGASEIWPDALVRLIDENEVSQKANLSLPYSGLWIEQGGWLSPPSLVSAMIAQAKATGLLEVKTNHRYIRHTEVSQSDTSQNKTLHISFEVGSDTDTTSTICEQAKAKNNQENAATNTSSQVTLCANHLILALGAGAVTSDVFTSLPLRPVRGQVEAIPTQAPISELSTVYVIKAT
jgi:tRNA 5-methylaminomethyl-2-thiouridine biosynthesis bifunctional protein